MGRGWKRAGYPRTAPVPYPTVGPTLAQANGRPAFAPGHHPGDGGERTSAGSDILQLHSGGDSYRGAGGADGPAANQFFAGAGCD